MQYLRALRIEPAKELLENSSLSVKEIAAEVGTGDVIISSATSRKPQRLRPLLIAHAVAAMLLRDRIEPNDSAQDR